MFAKISGVVYLAAVGMLYGLWRLWQGKEPFDPEETPFDSHPSDSDR